MVIILQHPVNLVRASVKADKVYAWLALNMLFTIGGSLHIILQWQSTRSVVIDTVAVAIKMDASRLLDNK
jgi:hypothetical protein